MVLIKLDVHMRESEVGLLFHTPYKINSEYKTVKLLGKNTGINFYDLGLHHCFLYIHLKYSGRKEINWASSKFKTFVLQNYTVKKVKRHLTE